MNQRHVAARAAALLLVLTAGCSSTSTDHGLGDTPLEQSAAWVLDQIEEPNETTGPLASGLTEAPVRTELLQTIRRVAADGPWTIDDAAITETTGDLVLRSSAGRTLLLHLEHDNEGKVDVLWFGPAIDRRVVQGDLTDVERIARDLPISVSMTTGSAKDGRLHGLEVTGSAADEPLPIASVSKIVLVAAVADAVSSDRFDWSTEVQVEARDTSQPVTDASPRAGENPTLDELAVAALSAGDNTAADVLWRHVGQEQISRTWERLTGARWEHTFLSTKQVLEGGWGPLALPVGTSPGQAEHRLDEIADRAGSTSPQVATTARWPDGLDWTMRGRDVARIAAWLVTTPGLLGPGVEHLLTDPAGFAKPGGTPGVVSTLVLEPAGDGVELRVEQFVSEHPTDVGDAEGLRLLGDRLQEAAR